MLTEKLNIHHLHGVVGGSMGGLQALQWAVSYPDFVDKVVAIEATPKISTYDMLWMHTYAEAVKSDTACHNGNYTVNSSLPLATHISQMVLTTPSNLNKMMPTDSLYILFRLLEKNPFKVGANNILWQTKAVMTHNITANAENTVQPVKTATIANIAMLEVYVAFVHLEASLRRNRLLLRRHKLRNHCQFLKNNTPWKNTLFIKNKLN